MASRLAGDDESSDAQALRDRWGRPVAELAPVHRRRWVGGPSLAGIWRGDAPLGLAADLEELPADVVDPFAP